MERPQGSVFRDRVESYRQRVTSSLDQVLPQASIYPVRLHEAMRYASDGGKRLRALLVYATGEVLEAPVEALDAPACALELIHAYSLTHDDLPAMDDDDLRRGRPSCHKAYDEATAILVGDALQTAAFQVLAQPAERSADPASRLRMVELLAEASGSRGMAGGQAIDLASEGQTLSLAELEALHIHKTGALIRCCILMAAQAAIAVDASALEAVDQYGKCLGLAYQIQDDVLDVEGASEALGKTAGKDEASLKSTYPSVMGLPAAKARARELFDTARNALQPFGDAGEPLIWLANHIEGRDR